jgi:hypothetical protein
MRRSTLPALVVAVGISALAGGCRDIHRTESFTIPNFMAVRPERPLADVPVPMGFTYKEHGSYVYSGNYRVAKLSYRGTPKVEDCVDFFRGEMPQSRWAFVRESGVDERDLLFHNEQEEMTVRLSRVSGITSIEIAIKPRPV